MLVCAGVHAETAQDGRIWLNLNAQGALPIDRFGWYMEIQPRWREEGEEFDQRLLRPAVLYQLTPAASIWLGYANVLTHRLSLGTTDEDRLWQQFSYTHKFSNDLSVQSRTRLEQRWLDNGDDVGHRIRQMFRVSAPLGLHPKLSTILWNEIFLNFNDTDWGANSGFDQNRLFVGIGVGLTPNLKLETGYLNQYVESPDVDRMNHVFATTVVIKF